MSTTATTILIVVVLAVLVISIGAIVALRGSRRRQLRSQFGSEYERTVQSSGNSRQADAELRARARERERISIRPLSPAQGDRYRQDWQQVQAEFVDVPARSLSRADALVTDVMVDRGYPMEDFDRQSDLVSVDHPEVVQHFREAHGIFVTSQAGKASTEELRQAFVSYRMLFSELLEDGAEPNDGEIHSGDAPSASARQER